MSHSGAYLLKFAGKSFDEDLLKLVVQNNGSCVGAARINEDGNLEVTRSMNTEQIPFEAIRDMFEQCKNGSLLFFAGNYPAAFKNDDVQPYTVISTDEQPFLVGVADGVFSNFSGKDDRSNAYQFFETYVKPKMLRRWEEAGKDVKAFSDSLRDPLLKMELEAMMGSERGSVTLVDSRGEYFTFGKNNELVGSYPFGWVTNNYGFKVKTISEKVSDGVKSAFGFGGSKGSDVSDGMRKAQEELAKTDAPTTLHEDVHEAGAIPDVSTKSTAPAEVLLTSGEPGDLVKLRVPDRFEGGDKAKKAWFRRLFGDLPSGWNKATHIKVPKHQLSKKDLSNLAVLMEAEGKTPIIKAGSSNSGGTPPSESKPSVPATGPGIIPPTVKEKLKKDFFTLPGIRKAIAHNGIEIPTPSEIKAMEGRLPSFAEQNGLSGLHSMFGWPMEMREQFCMDYPDAAAVVLRDMEITILRLMGQTGVKRLGNPDSSAEPVTSAPTASGEVVTFPGKTADIPTPPAQTGTQKKRDRFA